MTVYRIPLVVRGEVIFDNMVVHKGRINGLEFETPDASKYLEKIVISDCSDLSDLYDISLDEIIDYMVELGGMLDFSKNSYLQEAYEVSKLASNLPDAILHNIYEKLPFMLTRSFMEDVIDAQIGRQYLESWVPHRHYDGRTVNVRAFGSRAAHIIPGNLPA